MTERERIAHLTTDERGQAVLVLDGTGEALDQLGVCLAGGQKTTLFSTPQSLKAYCRRSGVSDRVSDVFVS